MITFYAMNHECVCTENKDFVYFAALVELRPLTALMASIQAEEIESSCFNSPIFHYTSNCWLES